MLDHVSIGVRVSTFVFHLRPARLSMYFMPRPSPAAERTTGFPGLGRITGPTITPGSRSISTVVASRCIAATLRSNVSSA